MEMTKICLKKFNWIGCHPLSNRNSTATKPDAKKNIEKNNVKFDIKMCFFKMISSYLKYSNHLIDL